MNGYIILLNKISGFVNLSVIVFVFWIVKDFGINLFNIMWKNVIILKVIIKDKVLVIVLVILIFLKSGCSICFIVGLLS